jgi:hypothetical protein
MFLKQAPPPCLTVGSLAGCKGIIKITAGAHLYTCATTYFRPLSQGFAFMKFLKITFYRKSLTTVK